MINKISAPILKISGFMGFAAVVTLAAAFLYLILLRTFCWNKKRLSIFGLFYGLSDVQIVRLSLLYLRILNLVYLFVFFCEIEQIRVLFFSMTGCFLALLAGKFTRGAMELVNTVLLMLGVIVANLLSSYMREVQFEWGLLAVYGLLALFTCGYCCYFTLKSIRELSEERREKNAAV